jgi:Concanavalin A-like lectin/glucanases superfamily
MKHRTAVFAGLLSLTILTVGCDGGADDSTGSVGSLDEHEIASGASAHPGCRQGGFGNHAGGGIGGSGGEAGKLGAAGSSGEAGKLGTGGSGGTAPSCATAPSGMVSWWHADGNFKDAVGSNDAASGGDVGFGAGEINQGFQLDGTAGSFVRAPDAASLEITGAITIDAWINSSTVFGRIVDKITAFGADGVLLDLVNTGQLRMIVQGDGITSPAPISSGAFNHVAGVYDGANLSLYLNGVLIATKATDVAAIPVNHDPLTIGADSTGASNFTGVIDEPRVFDRALSAAEIAAVFQSESNHCQ